jgi:NADH-quinone oxidoreductase subunit I
MSNSTYGLGVFKGLGITLRHFVDTYTEDLRWFWRGGRYWRNKNEELRGQIFNERQGINAKGVITVMYPEERLESPERFRFVPFLVMDDPAPGQKTGKEWCTSCGICAKVCPPQCIWIERGKLPNGRPKPEPVNFYIDIDICMNCGYCAEYCPFDAIKMDHDFELASYDRSAAHIHDKERLMKPLSYWQSIAPGRAEAEKEARLEAEAAKKKKKS